tara:strand:- start:262 stop:600 length:339 start_codon:yes stop_codon:yes gene_type:complete
MFNQQKVQEFKGDFLKAVSQLEKDYGVAIDLGTISFNNSSLRVKMTAIVGGEKIVRLSKNDFIVGDIVSIIHKKVDSKRRFKIEKINAKNIKVSEIEGYSMMTVSPSLLIKK